MPISLLSPCWAMGLPVGENPYPKLPLLSIAHSRQSRHKRDLKHMNMHSGSLWAVYSAQFPQLNTLVVNKLGFFLSSSRYAKRECKHGLRGSQQRNLLSPCSAVSTSHTSSSPVLWYLLLTLKHLLLKKDTLLENFACYFKGNLFISPCGCGAKPENVYQMHPEHSKVHSKTKEHDFF